MTLPVRVAPAATPVPLSHELDGALRFSVAKLDPPIGAATRLGSGSIPQHEISPADAPHLELRSALESRLASIAAWMRPAGHEVATEEYRMLAANLEAKDADDDTVMREQLGFLEATATLPAFALRDACTAFRHGKVGGGRWMPKAGEVRREAEMRLQALARERRLIETVLAAKVRAPVDPSRKEVLLAAARGLVKTMPMEGMKAEMERIGKSFDEASAQHPLEPHKGEVADAFQARMLREAHEAAQRPLPKLSDEHRRKLGLPPSPLQEAGYPDSRFEDEHAA